MEDQKWESTADHQTQPPASTGGWESTTAHQPDAPATPPSDTGTPPAQKGFFASASDQFSPKVIGATIAATAAPVTAMAAGFGASDAQSFEKPGQQEETSKRFKAAHDATAEHIKNGNYLGAARQLQDLFLGEGLKEPVDAIEDQIGSGNYSGAAGTALGALGQLAVAHGIGKIFKVAPTAIMKNPPTKADPALDLIQTYKPSDPRFNERAPGAIADIKRAAPSPITSNEHISSVSPHEVVTPALTENRAAWDKYFNPAVARGVQRSGQSILDATKESLKGSISPEHAQAVLSDASSRYGRNIGVRELQEMLNEKNGELQPFYSKSEAVKGAAEQGGALTGRSQALLEAQAKAIRKLLYEALDPDNKGAGPREIQRRYGAIKMVSNEANDARNAILAEHAGTPAGKVAKTALATADLITAPLREGGLTEGFLKIPQQFRGKSDPIIARAFRNAPEWQPYPEPDPTSGMKALSAGPIITPAPEDASSVRGVPAHEPFRTGFPQKSLPPARPVPVNTEIGSQHGDVIGQPQHSLNMPGVDPIAEANFRRLDHPATIHDMEESVARAVDARQRLSMQLTGKEWNHLSNSERTHIDDLVSQGYGFSVQKP